MEKCVTSWKRKSLGTEKSEEHYYLILGDLEEENKKLKDWIGRSSELVSRLYYR